MKKLISIILVLTMLVFLTFNSNALELNEKSQEITLEKVSFMDTEYYQHNISVAMDQLSIIRKEFSNKDFHPFFDENGMLNILIYAGSVNDTQSKQAVLDKFNDLTQNYNAALKISNLDSQKVIFKKAEFSNEYLLGIQSFLNRYMEEYNIVYVGSGDKNNQVKIGVTDLSKSVSIIDLLSNNIKSFEEKAVCIEKTEDAVEDAQRSFPGRQVYWKEGTTLHLGTSGFNAKDKSTGKYGIVTAAHVAQQGKTLYNRNDVAIGQASHWQYENSMDAAFIPFNDGFSPSVAIDGDTNNKISTYVKVAEITEGMPVSKCGRTTGITSGVVTDAAASVGNLTRIVLCTYSSSGGDSGGPVYLKNAYGGHPKNAILSIHNGRFGNYAYSTKVGFALATFNLSLYTG